MPPPWRPNTQSRWNAARLQQVKEESVEGLQAEGEGLGELLQVQPHLQQCLKEVTEQEADAAELEELLRVQRSAKAVARPSTKRYLGQTEPGEKGEWGRTLIQKLGSTLVEQGFWASCTIFMSKEFLPDLKSWK